VFTLAYYTGYRWIKEVLPRTKADVRELDGNQWLFAGMTKNGTPRMKVVHPSAQWALKLMPFKRHWRDYYHAFEDARAKVGMKHVRAHDLRHSLASRSSAEAARSPTCRQRCIMSRR
jgi:integrase